MQFSKVFLFLLLCGSSAKSQDVLNSIPMQLKSNRDVFQITSAENGLTTLFLSDRKKVLALLLDDGLQITDSLSVKRPENKFENIIGYGESSGHFDLYWATTDHRQIYVQTFTLKDKAVSGMTYSFDLNDEKFLDAFTQNGVFYFLTTIKDSNFLKLYVFDNGKTPVTKTIDLSAFTLYDSDKKIVNISEIIEKNSAYQRESMFKKHFDIGKINSESPTALMDSGKKVKSYLGAQQFFITNDWNEALTQLITIDLKNYSAIVTDFEKSNSGEKDTHSNSFLFENKLFQLSVSRHQITVTIKDLNNKLLKTFATTDQQDISYSNSQMIHRSGPVGKGRVIKSTADFLQKISDKGCSISCYRLHEKLMVTIGSFNEANYANNYTMISTGAGVNMGASTLVAGGSYYIADDFNVNLRKYNSYVNRDEIYLNSLLDNGLNHAPDAIAPLAFDKIKKFSDRYYEMPAATIFKLGSSYIYGFYDKNKKLYQLRKFDE